MSFRGSIPAAPVPTTTTVRSLTAVKISSARRFSGRKRANGRWLIHDEQDLPWPAGLLRTSRILSSSWAGLWRRAPGPGSARRRGCRSCRRPGQGNVDALWFKTHSYLRLLAERDGIGCFGRMEVAFALRRTVRSCLEQRSTGRQAGSGGDTPGGSWTIWGKLWRNRPARHTHMPRQQRPTKKITGDGPARAQDAFRIGWRAASTAVTSGWRVGGSPASPRLGLCRLDPLRQQVSYAYRKTSLGL